MRFYYRAILLALGCSMSQAKRVKTLSSKKFQAAVDEEGDLFVMFFAPWCEHCKKMKPEFQRAANMADEADLNLVFAKCDATRHEDVARQYGVQGYPSLRYFKEREKQPIGADEIGETGEEIYEWVKKTHDSPDRIMELKSGKAIQKFLDDVTGGAAVGVVGFFEEQDNSDLYVEAAEKFRYPVRFAWTTKSYARKYLELEDDVNNVVVMYKPFDEQRMVRPMNGTKEHSKKTKTDMADMMQKMMGVPFEEGLKLIPEPAESKEFTSWVTTMMLPLVTPFTSGFTNLLFTGPVKLHVILIVDVEADNAALEDMMTEIAKIRRGEVLHVLMANVEATEEIREYFGVEDYPLPTVVLSDMRNTTDEDPRGLQYLWPKGKDVTSDALKAFENNFFDGKLTSGKPKKSSKKKKKTKSTEL